MRPSLTVHFIMLATLAMLGTEPRDAHAQSRTDGIALVALLNTPAGALPPTSYGADVRVASGAVDIVYGRLDFESGGGLNNLGIGYGFSAGRTRYAFQAGAITCDGCEGIAMLRFEGEVLLSTADAGSGMIGVGLQPALGIGQPLSEGVGTTAVAGTLGLPVSFTAGRAWRVTAFVTPAVGLGMLPEAEDDNIGWRPIIGGGLRMRGPSGIGFFIGAQRVLMKDFDDTLLGAGLSLRTGGSRG